jgi:MarR family
MNPEQPARQLLDRLAVRHPCDLDLLVFFARHPRALLTSQQLANFMGYDVERIAESLEVLVGAGFLERTPSSNDVARMYVFSFGGPNDESLPSLVQFVSTRDGRLTMRRALTRPGPEGTPAHAESETRTELGPRTALVRPAPDRIDDAEPRTRRRGGR